VESRHDGGCIVRAVARDSLEAMLQPFRDIADPELILFAEAEGEAVGWLPCIANLNEAFIHANGLKYPWDYPRLWWHMRRQPECLAIKSVLVLPDYWNAGVVVKLFDEMARRACAKGFKWADLSLTSDGNPNVPVLLERMGGLRYSNAAASIECMCNTNCLLKGRI